jgi:hypothetical protein
VENVVRVGFESGLVKEGKEGNMEGKGEYRMAWLWVEGWRARLRAGGDFVEKCRYGYDG